MAISFEYYATTYKGKLSESKFDELVPRAFDVLTLKFGSKVDNGDSSKKAQCYQVDYFAEVGINSNVESERLGDYNVTKKAVKEYDGMRISPIAIGLLGGQVGWIR